MSYLQSSEHGCREDFSVVFAGEVEAVDLLVVPPLVEGRSGLVVLQPLQNGTVDDHLESKEKTKIEAVQLRRNQDTISI